MADFVLGRLKFTFLGPWVATTSYIKDDIVTYGGIAYACTGNHTASSFFYTDISNWTKIAPGFNWTGAWTANTQYNLNDIVRYGADAYIVTTQHRSGNVNSFAANSGNFQLFAGGLEFLNSYANTVNYSIGDVVTFGGYSYIAANNNINQQPNLNTSAWSVLTTGYIAVGTYNPSTKYEPGQVVNYGAFTYVNKVESTGILPSNASYWSLVSKGQQYLGVYNSANNYVSGDIVRFGGNTYTALTETIGIVPTTSNTSNWSTITTGINFTGYYSPSIQYNSGDIAQFGGNNYIALTSTIGTSPTPANTTQWSVYNQGYRPQGTWSNTAIYQAGDTVFYANSTYVSSTINNINIVPANNGASWTILAQGSLAAVLTTPGDTLINTSGGLARLPVGANGQILVVSNTGLPQWEDIAPDANVYYVCVDSGQDNPYAGGNPQRPWKTIQYATQRLNSSNSPGQSLATIMVRAGTYNEQLPITVPPGCSIFGDTTRTTIVQPAAGLSLDGTTPNANSTMFYMSDSTGMGRMTLKGMTGYQPNTAITANTSYQAGSDISTHTIAGVFLRLNSASPIVNKSPYINDMTAISSGGIGCVIDGSVHASGNKSMLFHSFTCINDNGIGYYVTNGGRAEIVSCFTYFCYFGYVANNGGVIRALNGNNSYGSFGSVATGFLTTETPITANVYGSMIQYQAATLYPTGSIFTSNNYIKGATSNARALILSFQPSTQQIYFKYTGENANTFANNEQLVEFTSATYATPTSFYANSQTTGAISGQNGVILTINNISGNSNFLTGASIQFTTGSANTGYDPYAYTIASISNWSSNANTAIVTLTNTKPASNPAFDGQQVIIRQNFSNIRLTGHDFLGIGSGGIANTNYPNTSVTQYIPSNQTVQNYPGRVYYVTTDQSGNFQVGPYFAVNQATGSATLNASAFNLSGLSSLRLGSIGAQIGAQINEFSTDATMSQNSNVKVPTQAAVVSYIGSRLSTVKVSDAIYDPVYNSANTVYYANNNIAFYTDNVLTIANTSFNANGFITTYNEIVNPSIGGGGSNYRYNITYYANNYVNTITRTAV
jgi:hypothetical protein